MRTLRTLYARIQTPWRDSIRSRLAWSFVVTSLVLMVLTGTVVYHQHEKFLHTQGMHQTSNLVRSLAMSSSSWVAANDLVGLQEVIEGFSATQDLKFAAIIARNGEILASTNAEQQGRFFTDMVSQRMLQSPPEGLLTLVSEKDLLDIAAPIMSGNRHVGWARIELTHNTAHSHLTELTRVGLVLGISSVVLTLLVAVLLGRYLTRRLDHLVRVVGEVVRSGRSLQARTLGSDEIGILGRDFNKMISVLDAQQQHLQQRNAELALYNQILQRIGQDAPLAQLLEELAEQIEALLPGTRCTILRLNPQGNNLDICAAPSLPQCCQVSLQGVALAQAGSSGAAALTGQRVIADNTPQHQGCVQTHHHAHDCSTYSSSWSEPIIDSTHQVLGVLTLFQQPDSAFPTNDTHLIERCTALAGLAIERSVQEESLRIAATAFESQQGMCMYILNADKKILRINQAFTDVTGFSAAEVVGQSMQILYSGEQNSTLYPTAWKAVEATGSWQGDIVSQRRSGEMYHQWIAFTAVRTKGGEISHYVVSFFDLTERRKAEAEIERLAYYDPLTALPNRRLLLDRLKMQLSNLQRTHKHSALLFMDLDHFKSINDTLGHDRGDLLLQQVGQRLSRSVRAHDTVARFGGDEFVILLNALPSNSQDAARDVAMAGEKLLNVLRQPYTLGDTLYHGTASMGATLFGAQSVPVDELLKQADLALYKSKAAGRDTLRFFDPTMQEAIATQVTLDAELRRGVAQQQFVLFYQPQVDAAGQLWGFEALLRWQHPERGLLLPAQFLSQAEDSGQILHLGRWVLEEGCRQLVRWAQTPATAALRLSINISARQWRQPQFATQMREILDATGARPTQLTLELSENKLLNHLEDSASKMRALQAQGVRFALDNFGTGYSSLGALKGLPLNQLKIDASFVNDILVNREHAAVAQAIIGLGHSLDLTVIAEGVESAAQAEFLRERGCQGFQGYHFGEPAPLTALSVSPELA